MRLPSRAICSRLRSAYRIACFEPRRAGSGCGQQVHRLGGELVLAAQALGDQQRLAGGLDRAVEAAEDVGDPADPVLDLADQLAVVDRLRQGQGLLEIAEVLLEVGPVLGDAREPENRADLGPPASSEGGSGARHRAPTRNARASVRRSESPPSPARSA